MSSGNKQDNVNGHIRQSSRAEGRKLLDRQTQRHLGISADEFIAAWRAGKYRDEDENPEVVQLAMMIPFAV